MKKAPTACTTCHLAAMIWFETYGSDRFMRPAERRQNILVLAVQRHRTARCWERVQDA